MPPARFLSVHPVCGTNRSANRLRRALPRTAADRSSREPDPACIRCIVRSLNGCVSEQELDLFQFTAGGVTQARAGSPEVVGCQLGDSGEGRAGPALTTYQMTFWVTFPFFRIDRKSRPLVTRAHSVQRSTAVFTQAGTGTVRTWPAFPTRSTIAQ